jgi:RNA polymerase sigma-54 factor
MPIHSPAIRLEHRQHQTLTPRLQQAVRLLQLSSLDFAQEVRDVLGKNPFLEHEEGADEADGSSPPELAEPGTGDALASQMLPTPDAIEASSSADPLAPETTVSEGEWDPNPWAGGPSSSARGSGDGETSAIDMMAADEGLRPHLHRQINTRTLSDRDRALVGCVIESLDDDGYLRTSLGELMGLCEMEPAVDMVEMNMALKLVQSLDPIGVGARSVAECLTLQLSEIQDEAQRELVGAIISQHMDKLAHHDVAGLARRLDRSPAEIEAACDRIRHMNPRPGWRLGSVDVRYITPDVIVRKVKGQWMAALNPAIVPRVRLNQRYAELFRRHRDNRHAELAAHLQEARWTLRNVEQRFSTILSVAQAILKRQKQFLEHGPLAMKPMALREIAEEVGLHESTVSRVTNNKYMATPAGVFELKYFFSRPMPTANGGACSATAIRGVIKDMIDAEDPVNPLSDAEIARRLVRQGLTVARRTVTKYRQLMKIAAVEQRRRLA